MSPRDSQAAPQEATPPASAKAVAGKPAYPSDLDWNELAEKYRLESLTQLRARAEKWATAMGSIVALVGIAGILVGRDTLLKVAEGPRWIVIAAAIVSLLSAAAATWIGARAAQGEPTQFYVTGPSLRAKTIDWGGEVVTDLRNMRIAAAFAFGAALLAAATLALAPKPAAADEAAVLIIRTGGTFECGSLSAEAGVLVVTPSGEDATPVSVSPQDVLSVHSVDGCP